ncbi:phenylacetate--CoA ligase family protein [Rossellomorea vietnamensis]|uniref:phenylacetate--CoA ligase family protein n=1 Tax=Rossellomorea vietnamensis TaxID=218284 RepID=UPI003CF80797
MILHEIETWDRSDTELIQLGRLQKTIASVYANVSFYREQLDARGIKPEDIKSLQDIQLLPFTTKSDLRNHYPFGLFAVPQEELVRVHASSGTSGKPTVVGYTQNDIDMWSEIVSRAIAAGGGKPGDFLHNAYGYGLFTGGLGLHYGSERLGLVTVPVSGGNAERQITLIEDFKPTVICGTPSYILNIAEKMEEQGKDPGKTSVKYGIFGAEPWSEKMRQKIEEKWNLKACDIYGLSEVVGPGVAMECHEAQSGLHIAEDHFLPEIIDPVTLESLPPGAEGELVFTSLTKEAFPIIRYRTGDIASLSYEECSCGRNTVKMSRVKGRVDDMMIIRGVNVFPSEVEHYLLTIEELSPYYQIHLTRQGTLDSVELHVEIKEEVFTGLEQNLEHENIFLLAKKIQHIMKSSCLVSMEVKVKSPKSLPRSEGKAVRVLDMRESGLEV